MSEFLKSSGSHLNALYLFAAALIDGENGKKLVEKYRDDISRVSPFDAMYVLDSLLLNGYSTSKVKDNTGKIINVFFKSLDAFKWDKPAEGHFLYYMMLENREAEKIIREMRLVIKDIYNGKEQNKDDLFQKLGEQLIRLEKYELHYIKKENILFPWIEKAFPQYRCLQIMWSFHDDFRKSIRELKKLLAVNEPDMNKMNRELGKLFFVVLPIIFREEQIVYPVALKALPEASWNDMLEQSHDTGWCYINPPLADIKSINTGMKENYVSLDTGHLLPEQINMLLKNLPVDITYVDENDQVVYFSSGSHRIFPRSKAIIGRNVQNCHPPDSVHIVNEIIDSFRKGVKDEAEFWIKMKGHFIHIRYFALRNEQKEYRGVLELSQDVTSIRSLEGERRLLDW